MPSLQDALLNALNKPAPTPDLKTTLNEWEQDDQPTIKEKPMANPSPVVHKPNKSPHFNVTNNVTRETLNYIRDHAGCARAEVTKALGDKGFNTNSVGSLIHQLMLAEQVRKDGDKLYALVSEYRPIKIGDLRKKRQGIKQETVQEKRMAGLKKAWAARSAKAASRKATTTAQHIIAKEDPKQKYQPKEAAGIAALSPTSVSLNDLTADKILDTLGVRQAKLLYAELKKIFEE